MQIASLNLYRDSGFEKDANGLDWNLIDELRLNHDPVYAKDQERMLNEDRRRPLPEAPPDRGEWVGKAVAGLETELKAVLRTKEDLKKFPDTIIILKALFSKKSKHSQKLQDSEKPEDQVRYLLGDLSFKLDLALNELKRVDKGRAKETSKAFLAITAEALRAEIEKATAWQKGFRPEISVGPEIELASLRAPPEKPSYLKQVIAAFLFSAAVLLSLYPALNNAGSQQSAPKGGIKKEEKKLTPLEAAAKQDDRLDEIELARLAEEAYKDPVSGEGNLDQADYRKALAVHDDQLKIEPPSLEGRRHLFIKLPLGQKGARHTAEFIVNGEKISTKLSPELKKAGFKSGQGFAGIRWGAGVSGTNRIPLRVDIMADGFYIRPSVLPHNEAGGTFRPVLQGVSIGGEKDGTFPHVSKVEIETSQFSNSIQVKT